MNRDLRRSRDGLLFCTFVLLAYGLLMLCSATQPLMHGHTYFIKQCAWCGVAGVCFLICTFFPLRKLQSFAPWIGLLTVGLLLSVFIPGLGRAVKGSRRWIGSGGWRFQPSEPAKVGFVLFFSYFLTNHMRENRRFFKGFVRPLLCVGVFCALLMLEPDFGTTALFGTVAALLLFVRGIRMIYIMPAVIVASALFGVAICKNPVRFNRVLAFLDLENNRTTSGYQLWQSLLAFSSGGWFGCGIGQGRQQFFFLPEAHTDFIGAILAEELGIIVFRRHRVFRIENHSCPYRTVSVLHRFGNRLLPNRAGFSQFGRYYGTASDQRDRVAISELRRFQSSYQCLLYRSADQSVARLLFAIATIAG